MFKASLGCISTHHYKVSKRECIDMDPVICKAISQHQFELKLVTRDNY